MTELTHDDFLGGKLSLLQPKTGYRAGVDPVLLAAAVPAEKGDTVLELGCGAGAASLCLSARVDGLALTGVEIQPLYAELCRKNAVHNRARMDVVEADLTQLPAQIRNTSFDHVIMNPPYYDRTASTRANDQGRDTALGGDTALQDWIEVGAKRLRPKGYFTLIQRMDRLPETLASADRVLGSITVLPIQARVGRPSGLFILQARKNGRAAFRMLAPLILHCGDVHGTDGESYTAQVSAILRDGADLSLEA